MAKFPQADIDALPDETLPFRLQNDETLKLLHRSAEGAVFPYSLAHRALQLAAEPALENEWLQLAVDTGASVFESVAGAHPDVGTYDTIAARSLALASSRQFLDSIKSADDFIRALDYARERMQTDTPVLADIVEEASGRYVAHDAVAMRFALGSAGAVRGMQIFVDKRLEAVMAQLEEESAN